MKVTVAGQEVKITVREWFEWEVMFRLLTWTLSKFSRDYIHQVTAGSTSKHNERCGCCLITNQLMAKRRLDDGEHEEAA